MAARLACFVDMGDQFLALTEDRTRGPDRCDLGLVVDDKAAVCAALERAGVQLLHTGDLDFLDPWGNHVQVVAYADVQFAKTGAALAAMGLGHLGKTPAAGGRWRPRACSTRTAAPRGTLCDTEPLAREVAIRPAPAGAPAPPGAAAQPSGTRGA